MSSNTGNNSQVNSNILRRASAQVALQLATRRAASTPVGATLARFMAVYERYNAPARRWLNINSSAYNRGAIGANLLTRYTRFNQSVSPLQRVLRMLQTTPRQPQAGQTNQLNRSRQQNFAAAYSADFGDVAPDSDFAPNYGTNDFSESEDAASYDYNTSDYNANDTLLAAPDNAPFIAVNPVVARHSEPLALILRNNSSRPTSDSLPETSALPLQALHPTINVPQASQAANNSPSLEFDLRPAIGVTAPASTMVNTPTTLETTTSVTSLTAASPLQRASHYQPQTTDYGATERTITESGLTPIYRATERPPTESGLLTPDQRPQTTDYRATERAPGELRLPTPDHRSPVTGYQSLATSHRPLTTDFTILARTLLSGTPNLPIPPENAAATNPVYYNALRPNSSPANASANISPLVPEVTTSNFNQFTPAQAESFNSEFQGGAFETLRRPTQPNPLFSDQPALPGAGVTRSAAPFSALARSISTPTSPEVSRSETTAPTNPVYYNAPRFSVALPNAERGTPALPGLTAANFGQPNISRMASRTASLENVAFAPTNGLLQSTPFFAGQSSTPLAGVSLNPTLPSTLARNLTSEAPLQISTAFNQEATSWSDNPSMSYAQPALVWQKVDNYQPPAPVSAPNFGSSQTSTAATAQNFDAAPAVYRASQSPQSLTPLNEAESSSGIASFAYARQAAVQQAGVLIPTLPGASFSNQAIHPTLLARATGDNQAVSTALSPGVPRQNPNAEPTTSNRPFPTALGTPLLRSLQRDLGYNELTTASQSFANSTAFNLQEVVDSDSDDTSATAASEITPFTASRMTDLTAPPAPLFADKTLLQGASGVISAVNPTRLAKLTSPLPAELTAKSEVTDPRPPTSAQPPPLDFAYPVQRQPAPGAPTASAAASSANSYFATATEAATTAPNRDPSEGNTFTPAALTFTDALLMRHALTSGEQVAPPMMPATVSSPTQAAKTDDQARPVAITPSGINVSDTVMRATATGRPLDTHIQRRMNNMFGVNFEHVRVHTDEQAAGYVAEIGAEAFTVGPNIFFGANRYQPETPQGMALLGHELTHVVQQASLPSLGNGRMPETNVQGQVFEQQAVQNERLLLQHLSTPHQPTITTRTPVQRSIEAPAASASLSSQFTPLAPVHLQPEAPLEREMSSDSAFVQRFNSDSSDAMIEREIGGNAAPGASGQPGGEDMDALAEKIYRLLKEKLLVERERGGIIGSSFF